MIVSPLAGRGARATSLVESAVWLVCSASMIVLPLLPAVAAIASIVASVIFRRIVPREQDADISFGFLHPFCSSGGGGERVLWCAIKSIEEGFKTSPKSCDVIVYTCDGPEIRDEDILRGVKKHFNITIDTASAKKFRVRFVRINTQNWISASRYPVFTLLGQSLGSMVMAIDALRRARPHVFVDTTGLAFTYPVARWLGWCDVVSYTHYPTISTDMLEVVRNRRAQFNNSERVASSFVRTHVKLAYYKLFAAIYGWCGRRADVVMANSSWTMNHVNSIFRVPRRTVLVYPPCDTEALQKIAIDEPRRKPRRILSIAQFRPEKNHALQLRALHHLLSVDAKSEDEFSDVVLDVVGSCRNAGDRVRQSELEALRDSLDELSSSNVRFHVNAPYSKLQELLGEATVGIHTMCDEHFGISVVEMMAAGVVPIAHKSAGPLMDIIGCHRPSPGYLATNEKEYAACLARALREGDLSPKRRLGREHARRFSHAEFRRRFWGAIAGVLQTDSARSASAEKRE
eukprot:g3973.t1